jgi:hypothetical protein
MSKKWPAEPIIGKLVGFTKRWNPFNNDIYVLVEVNNNIMNIPIDFRQKKFILMEHSIDSRIPLVYSDGKWHIHSRQISTEFKMFNDNQTVF